MTAAEYLLEHANTRDRASLIGEWRRFSCLCGRTRISVRRRLKRHAGTMQGFEKTQGVSHIERLPRSLHNQLADTSNHVGGKLAAGPAD